MGLGWWFGPAAFLSFISVGLLQPTFIANKPTDLRAPGIPRGVQLTPAMKTVR